MVTANLFFVNEVVQIFHEIFFYTRLHCNFSIIIDRPGCVCLFTIFCSELRCLLESDDHLTVRLLKLCELVEHFPLCMW